MLIVPDVPSPVLVIVGFPICAMQRCKMVTAINNCTILGIVMINCSIWLPRNNYQIQPEVKSKCLLPKIPLTY